MRSPLSSRDQTTTPVPAQSASQPAPVQPAPAQPAPGMNQKGKVRRTRASAWWIGVIIAAVILVALLIFIAQNSAKVTLHYLGMQGQVSLAIALVLAAIAGVLLVAIPGTARVIQLRRALKKNVNSTTR